MIDINYRTRVFIDKKTNRVTIRVRWNNNETSFALDCKADPEKWDGNSQRPMPGTIHKFVGQNNSAKVISRIIEDGLDMIKVAFTKCELESIVPSKDVLKTMIRGDQPKEEVKLKKTLAELFEEFLETASDDNNWTEKVHHKYEQTCQSLVPQYSLHRQRLQQRH